jgi:N-acetylglutamate synthase-like GNAT family acetyltransferase
MIENFHGLRIAHLDADQVRAGEWRSVPADIEVIRVRAPDPKDHADLARSGFVVKPSRVSWLADTLDSEELFLGGLPAVERQTIARSRRALDESGIEIHQPERLTESSLDAFLRQYEQQVAAMRYGVAFAVRERDAILDNLDDYLIVNAYAGRELVGGCVSVVRRDRDTMHIRFSATHPRARHDSLVRPLYLRAVEAARELELGAVSLGNDTTLYGHIVKPGLFRFKARFGFVPVPAHLFSRTAPADEADLVRTLGPLPNPSLLLGYTSRDRMAPRDRLRWQRAQQACDTRELISAARATRPLSMVVLGKDGDAETEVEAKRYRADFLGGVEVRRLPG